ncbi:MAG: bacterial extracellular solute-binding family protein [Hyphomicrobiales bacterium]|nr:bacterial extracellular solute-binding family protein [Hyphomicrobiales bacterium]
MTDQLQFLCAGGFRAAMDLIAPQFEASHNMRLAISYATPARTREYLEAGFPFDAGVIVAGVLKKAQADGLAPGVATFKLAVSPVGYGVAEANTAPDISTLDAFKRALAAVPRLGLSDPKAGTNLGAETLAHAERLGFGDAMREKIVWFEGPGSFVSAAVARGEADAVITLASEIAPIPGIRFAGKLAPELQTEYAMQALAAGNAPAAATALMDYLRGPVATDIMRRVGLEPVA